MKGTSTRMIVCLETIASTAVKILQQLLRFLVEKSRIFWEVIEFFKPKIRDNENICRKFIREWFFWVQIVRFDVDPLGRHFAVELPLPPFHSGEWLQCMHRKLVVLVQAKF